MHSFPHNKTQNITLLKGNHLSNSLNLANPELKKELKQIQTAILQAQQALTQKRIQMKKMSQNINKMVEKKYSKAPKERPLLFPGYQNSQRLQKLYSQRDQIYRQIAQIKATIKTQKPDNQSQLITQTLKKRANYDNLISQIQKNAFQVEFLASTLEKGKMKIDLYNQSTVIKNISQNQKQLQQTKRQYKLLEKEHHACFSEQVFANMYFFLIKDYIQNFDRQQLANRNKDDEIKVDQGLIQMQIKETTQVLQQRNKIQKELAHIIAFKKKEIQKQVEVNQMLQKGLRQIMNQSLKIDLQTRRFKSQNKRVYQIQQINNKISPKKGKFSIMLQKKIIQVQRKSVQLKKNSPREATVVTIMNWFKKDINQQGNLVQGTLFSDDAHDLSKTDHLKYINFFLNSKRGHIYGLQMIYEDSYCNQINGKKMMHQLGNNQFFQTKQILADGLKSIFYCAKCSNQKQKKSENAPKSSNSNTSISFLKFQYQGNSEISGDTNEENADDPNTVTVGNSQYCSCSLSSLKKISLQNLMIKTISLLLFPYLNSIYENPSFNTQISNDTPSYTEYRLKSMKITLIPKKIQQKIQLKEQSDDGKPPRRSYSVSDVNKFDKNTVIKKKVIIRGKTLKKISEEPQIDFRLQMNNRNKMV